MHISKVVTISDLFFYTQFFQFSFRRGRSGCHWFRTWWVCSRYQGCTIRLKGMLELMHRAPFLQRQNFYTKVWERTLSVQLRIQDYPLGGGERCPLTRALFGGNVCENERIGSHLGSAPQDLPLVYLVPCHSIPCVSKSFKTRGKICQEKMGPDGLHILCALR